jgi:threonine dehydratase
MAPATELRAPVFDDIVAAARRIAPLVIRTPVVFNAALNQALGCQAWCKCENLQETGSFKMRGAANAVLRLREQGHEGDVATHSSGNHGAALARAARLDGRMAHVVMPANAVQSKIESVRQQGGEVILCPPIQAEREAGLARLVARGLTPIPPYDHSDIIAGQGTATLELLEESGPLDLILAPVGGGGLVSGSAIAAHGVNPSIRVMAAEPAGAADTAASVKQGRRVTEWHPETIADGLRALVGKLTFQVIRAEVDQVLTVSEQGIVDGMKLAKSTLGMAIEPSSATVLAAILEHPALFRDRRVGLILSGGNVEHAAFPFLDAPI